MHGMVQKLMEDPIRQVEALLERLGPSQINAQGKSFCSDFSCAHEEVSIRHKFQDGCHAG